MIRLVAVALLAVLSCAGHGSSPSAPPTEVSLAAPPSASASLPLPRRPVAAEVAWQHDFPASVETRRVATGADGTIAVGLRFSASIELGGRGFTPRGEADVAIVFYGADGTPLGAVQLGGSGDDALEDLAASASGFVAVVRSDQGFVEAGRVAQPGPGFDGAALLVHLRTPGEVVRADVVPAAARGVRVAGHDSGDLFVGWSVPGEHELFGEATVTRSGSDGVERWRQGFPACELHQLSSAHESVVASVRCRPLLEARSLAARDGARGLGLTVEKLPSAGDLGTLQGFAIGSALVAFGETGGAVRAAGADHPRPSYAIQPFFAEAEGAGARYLDVADATARFVGAGLLDSVPAAVLDVIHAGQTPEAQPGVYWVVATSGSPPTLHPLARHDAHSELADTPLDPRHAVFVDGGVIVVGTLGTESRYATVIRYHLPRVPLPG